MEKRLLILFTLLCGLFTALHSAESNFSLEEPNAAWNAVVEQMEGADPVRCRFHEERENTFYRHPRIFGGVIRWSSRLGLSIQYKEPGDSVLQITEAGILFKRGDDERVLGNSSEQQAMFELFSRLFAWDLEWMEEQFDSQGQFEADGNWILSLKPREGALSDSVQEIRLAGGAQGLAEIALDLRGGRKTRISLSEQETRVVFDDEELKLAFPSLYE